MTDLLLSMLRPDESYDSIPKIYNDVLLGEIDSAISNRRINIRASLEVNELNFDYYMRFEV